MYCSVFHVAYNENMHELVPRDTHCLWQYHYLQQPPAAADCMIVMADADERVAQYAGLLLKDRHYWNIVIVGAPEIAQRARDIMHQLGYEKDLIIHGAMVHMSHEASAVFKTLQELNGPMPLSIHVVTMPYFERRVSATFQSSWPDRDTKVTVSSPYMDIDTCVSGPHSYNYIVAKLVGETERIIRYSSYGYIAPQQVTGDARAAYGRLIAAGFTQEMIKN